MQGNIQNTAGTSTGWHVANWGAWGWAETILKLIAVAAGIIAFFGATSASGFILSGNSHLAAVILGALLTFVTLAVIAVRITQREVIAVIFAILNALGHLGVLFALLRLPDQTTWPIIFGVFWVLGQFVKVQFLNVSGYTEGGSTSAMMRQVTIVLAVVYIVFTVLVIV